MFIKCKLGEGQLILGSIYGPNKNENEFFEKINNYLLSQQNCNIIMGGDFNATWDCRDAEDNIDTLFMVNPPSVFRSEKINWIARNNNLTDPYRFLYPSRLDYTYIPNATQNKNRSRIDYFLITSDLCDRETLCEISESLLTKSFDHKMVTLGFDNKKGTKNKGQIKNQILKDDCVGLRVKLTVMESYLHNSDPQVFPSYQKRVLLESIGSILEKINRINLLRFKKNEQPVLYTVPVAELIQECKDSFELLPDLTFFEAIEKTCTDAVFFETLIMNLKNSVLTDQKKIFDAKNHKKKVLSKRLSELKTNYRINANEIQNLEHELANVCEAEIREEVLNLQVFDRLTSEKMTPHFLNLAKASNCSDSTSIIKDGTGTEFTNSDDNRNYIKCFYENLYRKPENQITCTKEKIIEFLGDVANEEEVVSAKLTDAEKNRLERDLHITELDLAISQSKKKGSPGIDGFNYTFIRTFWQYLRSPLYRYAIDCLENGRLTDNFKTAKIRLIPKKGDVTKIGNWRPISLLSCFYKLISRVFTNRISTVIDKVTRCGQKGYSKTKQCQEVLISIINGIAKCKKQKIRGVLVSLDIKKAFDSISHSYLNSALEFFNFGRKFISNITTLCTGRKASIILDDGSLSNVFDLERGNAQGDTISPYLFNIGYQILLLKINYDLQITGFLDIPDSVPREGAGAIPDTVSKKTRKVFAFADDCTALLQLTGNNLKRLKEILADFYNISGLECNIEKSCIMPIGDVIHPDPLITNSGFEPVEKIKILGITIKNECDDWSETEQQITGRVKKEINFWKRFNLSLPGRLNIAKTMLYSQLNYAGCFLPLSEDFYARTEQLIGTYVSDRLKIASKRLFLKPECGGLGLFRVKDFLSAQKCSWIKRAAALDELWKIELAQIGEGNIFGLRSNRLDPVPDPIFKTFVDSYEQFLTNFTKRDNYKKSFIFDNPAFTLGIRSRQLFDKDTMGNDTYAAIKQKLYELTFDDITVGPLLKNNAELERAFEVPITREISRSLEKLVSAAVTRYKSNIDPVRSVPAFFSSLKKGSKKIRRYFDEQQINYIPHNIEKFSANTDTVIGIDICRTMNSMWKTHFLSNSVRTFYFKLINNVLGLNYIICHFVANIERNCTFCNLRLNPDPEDEDPLHFFFGCESSEFVINHFFNDIMGTTVSRQEFFAYPVRENKCSNLVLFFASLLLKKYFWDCRLRNVLPDAASATNFIFNEFKVMTQISSWLKSAVDNSGFSYLFRSGCKK
jgi:Reverse transcriptase (RNA-dependent DNA polymerase)